MYGEVGSSARLAPRTLTNYTVPVGHSKPTKTMTRNITCMQFVIHFFARRADTRGGQVAENLQFNSEAAALCQTLSNQ